MTMINRLLIWWLNRSIPKTGQRFFLIELLNRLGFATFEVATDMIKVEIPRRG